MANFSTTQCQGWSNPSTTFYGPVIISLSSYYSPAGSTSLVTIYGENFYSYSTVLFATYNPSVYFISSTTLQFYVPSSLYPGTYPVQVFNGSFGSNIVTYNLDNSSGFWILNPDNSITNTNAGGVNINNNVVIDSLQVINSALFNNASFNQNIIMNSATPYPSPSSSYIQFPDGSQQVTAYKTIIGEIKMYAGLTLPPNYVWCDGSPLSISVYPNLFNVLGYTYGGAGLFFKVPNLLQKFPMGSKDTSNMSVNYTDSTGTVNTVSTGGNQTMAQNQLGQHTHTFAANVHVTGNSVVTAVNNNTNYHDNNIATSGEGAGVTAAANVAIGTSNGNIGVNVGGTVGNNNYNNTQEDILPPFTVIQYIICYQ